ncbi:hypothetical protein BGZ68_004230 [Mortierella alpina]|nr:hypothetical protein BGZ68_004230 [Mortierella alpina]
MSSTFSQHEISQFKESFAAFDTDKNGSINKSELRSLLRIVGEKYHATAISESMNEFDTNNDQLIDFDEFLVLVSKLVKNKTP